MSKYSTVSMFVGWHGDSVWLGGGSEWPDNHPIVAAYPDYFTDIPPAGAEPPKRKPGRPLGSKNQPKTGEKADA